MLQTRIRRSKSLTAHFSLAVIDVKRDKTSFIYLYLVSSVTYSAFAFIGPFLGAYYRLNDLTGTQIGVLNVITCLSSLLIQPLWAAGADRTGRAGTFVRIIALGAGLSALSYCFAHSFGGFVMASLLYALFYTSVSPMIDTISMRECRTVGCQFSFVRLGGTISYAVIALIIGRFVQKMPVLSFILGSAAYFVLLLLLFGLPDSENHQPQPEKKGFRFVGRLSDIFTDRSIYFVLILAFIFQLGFGFLFSFLSVYVTDLGYGQSLIGILQFISAATEIPILLLIHRIEKRFGSLKLIAFAVCLMGIRLLLCAGGTGTGAHPCDAPAGAVLYGALLLLLDVHSDACIKGKSIGRPERPLSRAERSSFHYQQPFRRHDRRCTWLRQNFTDPGDCLAGFVRRCCGCHGCCREKKGSPITADADVCCCLWTRGQPADVPCDFSVDNSFKVLYYDIC